MPIQQLLEVMQQLREQCPWDKAQTPQSLTRYAIEEAYEVEDAIRQGNLAEIRNELGDLLLQVVFQSQMYAEQQAFNFDDVVQAITEKLIRRHPHVFQAEQYANLSPEQVSELWQQIKQQEKQGQPKSYLDQIKHGPAIMQAEQIQGPVGPPTREAVRAREDHQQWIVAPTAQSAVASANWPTPGGRHQRKDCGSPCRRQPQAFPTRCRK